MNKKLYFNIVFYIVGSFLLATLFIIVGLNFFKDARVFEKPVAVAVEDTSVQPSADNGSDGTDDYKTIKYQRAADAVGDSTDYGEAIPKATPDKAASAKKANGIKVEVLNYTGNKKLADEIKTTLEAGGFEVSIVSEKTDTHVSTSIIERNDKKAGLEVQKVLKAGKVVKWADPKSKFDVTVRLGGDYLP